MLLEASSNEDTLIGSLNLRDFRPNLCPHRRPQEIKKYHGPGCPPTDNKRGIKRIGVRLCSERMTKGSVIIAILKEEGDCNL